VAAREEQWRGIVYSDVIFAAGFAIFVLSDFPPTQRFGLVVLAGLLNRHSGQPIRPATVGRGGMEEKGLNVHFEHITSSAVDCLLEGQMEVQEIFAILHKWGIHTLGQLAALDKEQLGARLGPEAIRMWERANGRSSRLLKLVQPPNRSPKSLSLALNQF